MLLSDERYVLWFLGVVTLSISAKFSTQRDIAFLAVCCRGWRYSCALLVSVLVLLSGCSTTEVRLDVGVNAGDAVNPSVRGRASPVVVRFYQLKNNVRFNGADFLSLYEKDKEVLGDEMISREERILEPGKVVEFDVPASPDMRFLGVFAGFRDVERAQWRDQVAFDDELRHSWFSRKIRVPVGVALNGQRVRVELFKSDEERNKWASEKVAEGGQLVRDKAGEAGEAVKEKAAEGVRKKGEDAAGKALGKVKLPF